MDFLDIKNHAKGEISCNHFVESLVRLLSLRDLETEEHAQRVSSMTLQLARAVNLPKVRLWHVYQGALLHDIGKIGIPDAILHKKGLLNDDEEAVMRMHPNYAYELFHTLPCLRHVMEIPYCHHEKWDGTGYPRGLKRDQIPLEARLFSIIDVWDALTSDRPYRTRWSEDRVIDYIRLQSGKQFEPRIVKIFFDVFFDPAAPNQSMEFRGFNLIHHNLLVD